MNTGACIKYVCHSKRVLDIAAGYGWRPGARYTNLRDVKHLPRLGFLDIDWKKYSLAKHLEAAAMTRPELTVAVDVENISDLSRIIDEAYQLANYAERVIIVPKDVAFVQMSNTVIPECFRLGYSVPTRYGGTKISPDWFRGKEVHLLGGRPDVQRTLADRMNVVSLDTNRFTLDAQFGDFFDGRYFRPHPKGGYDTCIHASLENINAIW